MQFDGTFLLIIVSFFLFMLLMRTIYFEPIRQIQAKRAKKLADDEAAARQLATDYDYLSQEYEQSLAEARRKAQQLIQTQRQGARVDAEKTIAEARQKAQASLDATLANLAQERESVYQQLGQERQALAALIVAKVKGGVSDALSVNAMAASH